VPLAARRIAVRIASVTSGAIPVATRIERRSPGRPRGRRIEPADRLLRSARRWLSPAELEARPELPITQTMELGVYEDQRRLEEALGRERLAQALRRAEAGRFSERSWTYWHYRLGLARPGRVPPLPQRRLR
jgi:hypothetical protein